MLGGKRHNRDTQIKDLERNQTDLRTADAPEG